MVYKNHSPPLLNAKNVKINRMIFQYWFENEQTDRTEDNLELNDSPVFTYIFYPAKRRKNP